MEFRRVLFRSGRKVFKKDESSGSFNKNAKPFKKNYDGRGPATEGSSNSSRPYSGRITGADNSKRTSTGRQGSFDKPSLGNEKGGTGGFDANRRPRKDFDKPPRTDKNNKPFSDRPKRTLDKPGFKRDHNNSEGEDRKQIG